MECGELSRGADEFEEVVGLFALEMEPVGFPRIVGVGTIGMGSVAW